MPKEDKSSKKQKSEGLLDIIANYKHLINPFYALGHVGTEGQAPGGAWALSKNPKVNLGLWNALGVSAVALPTAALAAYFTNKWWERKMRKAVNKASVAHIAATRPILSPDDDLSNISNIVEDPEAEVNRVRNLVLKHAAEPASTSLKDDTVDYVKGVAAATLPLFALPLSIGAAKYAIDKIYEKRMRRRLLEDRLKLRNYQNLVDYDIMKTQGLVKGASVSDKDRKIMQRIKDKELAREKGMRSPEGTIAAWPIVTALLGTGALAALAFTYLRNSDRARGTLNYVRKKVFGHNVMQTTPELGLEQFGIPVDRIVARPGDKKQPTYQSLLVTEDELKKLQEEEAKKKQAALEATLVAPVEAAPVVIPDTESPLLAQLEEVSPTKKKEDALF